MNAKTYVMTALLLTTAFTALAPIASAHPCTAEDPEQSCGECRSGVHSHRYRNGDLYCSSSQGDPGTNVCLSELVQIGVITGVELPDSVVIRDGGKIPPPDCVAVPELDKDGIFAVEKDSALLP